MHNKKILVSGASGLIGGALVEYLRERGATVFEFSHRRPTTLPNQLDVLINLAGENIGAHRWSVKQRREIYESRVLRTNELIAKLSVISKPPALVLSASAIGYYGNRGKAILSEDDAPGSDFLSTVATDWEAAAQRARQWPAVVTIMRFGIVLTRRGGALAKMLLPFRLGLGGKIGSGEQYMSWIALDDLLRAIEFLIEHPFAGAVNICAPDSVTNHEFTDTLARTMHRPALFPLPASVVKFFFGEMGEALLLSSIRVSPRVLTKLGFTFSYPRLAECFAQALKAPSAQ